jgi:hypothetical protein
VEFLTVLKKNEIRDSDFFLEFPRLNDKVNLRQSRKLRIEITIPAVNWSATEKLSKNGHSFPKQPKPLVFSLTETYKLLRQTKGFDRLLQSAN